MSEEYKPIPQDEYEKQYDELWEKSLGGSDENEPREKKDNDQNDNESQEQEVQENQDEPNNDDEQVGSDGNEEDELTQEQKEELIRLKAAGAELELTKDEVIELAKKGIDYTRKTQWLADKRRKIELIDDIPDEHLMVLKALKDGNKDALVKLAKDYDIDLYDLDQDIDPEIDYPPVHAVSSELVEIEQRIMADKETLPKVEKVLSAIPEDFKAKMAQEPKLLEGLYLDVKNGKAEPTINEALKQYYVYGGDFLQHYAQAYNKLFNNSVDANTIEQRKKATPPKVKTTSKKKDYLAEAEEIWNMPTEDFRKLKAKVLAKVGMKLD